MQIHQGESLKGQFVTPCERSVHLQVVELCVRRHTGGPLLVFPHAIDLLRNIDRPLEACSLVDICRLIMAKKCLNQSTINESMWYKYMIQ